ncbi:hypothetical protein CKO42_25920 [Lamprobacter modestohalophilus]|uniref:Uncharacterized protein n=1 Tax=Lamprobacter modestohalophilus TaxID=1064514 RepID=A0A9X0WE39_9GAMM|nr:hypothetical protein [Lamprobacter modestohalophilus]
MKDVCQALAKWQPKQPPVRLADLFLQPPTPDIQAVASAFVELQHHGHTTLDHVWTFFRGTDRRFQEADPNTRCPGDPQ